MEHSVNQLYSRGAVNCQFTNNKQQLRLLKLSFNHFLAQTSQEYQKINSPSNIHSHTQDSGSKTQILLSEINFSQGQEGQG